MYYALLSHLCAASGCPICSTPRRKSLLESSSSRCSTDSAWLRQSQSSWYDSQGCSGTSRHKDHLVLLLTAQQQPQQMCRISPQNRSRVAPNIGPASWPRKMRQIGPCSDRCGGPGSAASKSTNSVTTAAPAKL